MAYALRRTLFIILFFSSCSGWVAFAADQSKVELIASWEAYYLSRKSGPGKAHTVIIDVRGEEAYAKRHIEGALNIPAFILTTKTFPKDWHLVLSCSSLGMKDSIEVAAKLIAKGVHNVWVLEGGMNAWEGCGLPVVGDRSHEVNAVMSKNLIWALTHHAGVAIVDIRSRKEFEKSHIPGSKNFVVVNGNSIPASLQKFLAGIKMQDRHAFERKLLTLPVDERAVAKPYALTEVILVGRPGPVAESLTRLLHVKGFFNVRFLYGGFATLRGLMNMKSPELEADKD